MFSRTCSIEIACTHPIVSQVVCGWSFAPLLDVGVLFYVLQLEEAGVEAEWIWLLDGIHHDDVNGGCFQPFGAMDPSVVSIHEKCLATGWIIAEKQVEFLAFWALDPRLDCSQFSSSLRWVIPGWRCWWHLVLLAAKHCQVSLAAEAEKAALSLMHFCFVAQSRCGVHFALAGGAFEASLE